MKPRKQLTARQYQAASGITFILVLVAIAFLVGSEQVGTGIALLAGFIAGLACVSWGRFAHEQEATMKQFNAEMKKSNTATLEEFKRMSADVDRNLRNAGLKH